MDVSSILQSPLLVIQAPRSEESGCYCWKLLRIETTELHFLQGLNIGIPMIVQAQGGGFIYDRSTLMKLSDVDRRTVKACLATRPADPILKETVKPKPV